MGRDGSSGWYRRTGVSSSSDGSELWLTGIELSSRYHVGSSRTAREGAPNVHAAMMQTQVVIYAVNTYGESLQPGGKPVSSLRSWQSSCACQATLHLQAEHQSFLGIWDNQPPPRHGPESCKGTEVLVRPSLTEVSTTATTATSSSIHASKCVQSSCRLFRPTWHFGS